MVLNNVILSTPIVCIVSVIINIFIILHGHTMKQIGSRFRRVIGCAVLNTIRLQMVYSLTKHTYLTNALYISKIPYDFVVHATMQFHLHTHKDEQNRGAAARGEVTDSN